MKFFSGFNDRMIKVIDYIIVLLMASLLVMISFQVLNRFILHIPAAWTEEMGRYNFVWLCLFGMVKALKTHEHLSVDILVMNLNNRVKPVVGIMTELMTLIFCIILTQTGYSYMVSSIGVYCEFGQFPLSVIYAAIPISALFLCLISIEQLFEEIKKLKANRLAEKNNTSGGYEA